MKILSFETSCDETSVAIVEDGTKVMSCETATSLSIHIKSGGIIPENAARKQVEYIIPTLESALSKAFPNIDINNRKEIFKEIDAIAVTVGPGLVGSLLVGIETAKTLSVLFKKPLVPVNHVKAHIYSAWLSENKPEFPLIALVVSGGHTDFVYMKGHGNYEWIGGTRDDAAGECFDKCARLLGLPYPGGPSISKQAEEFRRENPNFSLKLFPRPMIHDNNFDVSFSGLKTAVSNYLRANPKPDVQMIKQLSAEVEEAICETLSVKSLKVMRQFDVQNFILCGGVSANTQLKILINRVLQYNEVDTQLHVPPTKYSTDNAAMIGAFAFFNFNPTKWGDVAVDPELHF